MVINLLHLLIMLIFAIAIYLFSQVVLMQDSAYASNCEVNILSNIDDDALTTQERIQLLEDALFASIDARDDCQQDNTQAAANLSGDVNGDSALQSDAFESQTGQNVSTVAVDDVSGTQQSDFSQNDLSVQDAPTLSGDEAIQAGLDDEQISQQNQGSTDRQGKASASKIVPQDIVAPNNDEVIKKIIYNKALNEPDPDLQKKLWEEYRKY